MGRGFTHTVTGEREERQKDTSAFTNSCDTSSRSSPKLVLIEKAAYRAVGMQQADSSSLKARATLLDTMKALNYTSANTQMHSERSPAGQFRALFKWSQAAVV